MLDYLKQNLNNLKNKLDSLSHILSEEQKTSEKEKKILFLNTEEKLNEILNPNITILNIGGKKFYTSKNYLLNFPESIFAQQLKNLKNGEEIFFDRPSRNFKIILEMLRLKTINLKNFKDKYIKEAVIDELIFYGLINHDQIDKRKENEIEWDLNLSKQGMFSRDQNDRMNLLVHSNSCYNHFVTNKLWTNEIFTIEFDCNVINSENYFYYGIVNENYSYSSNCFCCSPSNAFYARMDGNIYIAGSSNQTHLVYNRNKCIVGMKVNLIEKNIIFYVEDKEECGPFSISGNNFRVVSASCSNTNGNFRIISCFEE